MTTSPIEETSMFPMALNTELTLEQLLIAFSSESSESSENMENIIMSLVMMKGQ